MLHILGIYLFTNGFLLTRLILDHKSDCTVPPIDLHNAYTPGSSNRGCWHPKSFNKAVVLVIDALRYDFTVPFTPSPEDPTPHHYHGGLPTLHDTTVSQPGHAFLRPFIADPPTTTLQRLKGLTTGSLPTFIDAGSNFAGTSIDEDNLLSQLNTAGKNIVHLGDDTWQALFPDHFEPNLTKPFDSFNVPDLHTVDNGVITHLFPLFESSMAGRWDVIFGHFLGVDHVGHNFGPDHPAMTAKLEQMEDVVRRTMKAIDDDTLLVVMGDHGMDSTGNHGGESDDEVEAALWMYSKGANFGRSNADFITPPKTARERPIAQIDLVPTLALLLGLPIPANNLGSPIEETFIGRKGNDWQNMASVNRLTAAQAHHFQQEYATVRKPDPDATLLPDILWDAATRDWNYKTESGKKGSSDHWHSLAGAFSSYQQQNLAMFRGLWGTFDITSMIMGVLILLGTLLIMLLYATHQSKDTKDLHSQLCVRGAAGMSVGAAAGFVTAVLIPSFGSIRMPAFLGALICCVNMVYTLGLAGKVARSLPNDIWSWMCFIFVFLLAAGFGSNSFTVWEEEQLLYILAAFGTVMLMASSRQDAKDHRVMGAYHAIAFMVMIRLASFSRICREEQMPFCTPTFYGSTTSTTSAGWRLTIPWLIGVALPSATKAYYDLSSSYQSSAPFWISIAFRTTLFLIAAVWTLDTYGGLQLEWFGISIDTIKTVRIYVAQLVLCISVGAGGATFGWQGPLIGVDKVEIPTPASPTPIKGRANGATGLVEPPKTQIIVQGTKNLYGSHFAMLPFTVLLVPLLLFSKPMGQLSLFSITTAILSLLELLHGLRPTQPSTKPPSQPTPSTTPANPTETDDHPPPSPLGPTLLALLAHLLYFKTGHQAALASIQWDIAFLALPTLRYPWSPLFVVLNTFSAQILCAAAVPLVVLWRRPFAFGSLPNFGSQGSEEQTRQAEKRRKRLLSDVGKAQMMHFVVCAVVQLATTVFAAHLRRHLMLYRVFCPRWMLASVGMVVAELAGTFVGVLGVGVSVGAVGGVFGW